MTKIRIDLLENTSKVALNDDGSFNKQEAIRFSGREAGICYAKEGYNHIALEPVEKTDKRVSLTLNNGHHSVSDHVQLGLNLQNIPKILAMVLNNEHQYTTSEKSARYTQVIREDETSFISSIPSSAKKSSSPKRSSSLWAKRFTAMSEIIKSEVIFNKIRLFVLTFFYQISNIKT